MDQFRNEEEFLDIETLHDNSEELDADAACPCGCGMPIRVSVAVSF